MDNFNEIIGSGGFGSILKHVEMMVEEIADLDLVSNVISRTGEKIILNTLQFDYPPDIVYRFLESDCGVLALKLNELTGWPIYAIYLLEAGTNIAYATPAHYVVLTPNGLFLDIIGLRSSDDLRKELPVTFDIPADETIIKLTDRNLDNPDYYCDTEDLTIADIYSRDMIKRIIN